MVSFADEIPLGTGGDVASKAVSAESIHDVNGSSFPDRRSVLRHVEVEELPVTRRRVEALVALDHGLARYELDDGSWRIHGACRRIGGRQRRVDIASEIVH